MMPAFHFPEAPVKRLLLAGGAVIVVSVALAAHQLPGADVLAKIPGLDKVLAQKDALTTSLETATNGVAWLDLFEPASPQRMDALPRSADGGFDLKAGGFYEMRVQSFCLQAGTHRPAQGDGFLDAPLEGPRGAVIQHILEQASRFPDIPQADIQVLLWSILARARISDLPRDIQLAAGRLLTPAEVSQVNGGALGLIAGAVRDAAFDRLPPAVARALAAEADIRDLISRGAASYAEMESVAVTSDSDEPAPGDEIPSSRWNFRDGVYVRYQPDGYQESVVQVYVPGPSNVARAVRDAKGRLSRLTDPDGRVIEIAYDDSQSFIAFVGDPGVKAWALARITYTVPARDGGQPEVGQASVEGWTLVGAPNGKGAIRRAGRPVFATPPTFGMVRASFASTSRRVAASRDDGDLTDDLQARYNRASKMKGYIDKASGQGHKASAGDVVDEGHYRDGIDKVKKLDFKGEGKWINEHNESVGKLAAYTHCELSASCSPDGGGGKHFNPAGKAGVPAAGQRIGMSGRSAR
jgi:hypothetical protein